jgi:uncharacterized protein YjbI with pentapeptide repeats
MTLTKENIIGAVSDRTGFSKKKSRHTVNTLIEIIKSRLESGENIKVSHFGKLDIKEKKARRWRSPFTNEIIMLPLSHINLQGADLQGADLCEADLYEADLQDADLDDAILEWASLDGAKLQRASLHRADLRWANLEGTNMEGANLRFANLEGANLKGAKLSETLLQSVPHRQG